ncbi:AraC family transcriptional regulator [soil metagenome]
MPPPGQLRELAECLWTSTGAPQTRVLPDGCMDLIELDGEVVVAGPDTAAHLSDHTSAAVGLRFRPGTLPRLLGIPAAELRNQRVPLRELRPATAGAPLLAATTELLRAEPTAATTPWSLPLLGEVTYRLGAGTSVRAVADEAGYSARNLQRHCTAVYGYPPATLRRVLRFRRALGMVRAGVPVTDAAAQSGYADQSHLYRDVRDLAGVPLSQLLSGANKSTEVPSGSVTVA